MLLPRLAVRFGVMGLVLMVGAAVLGRFDLAPSASRADDKPSPKDKKTMKGEPTGPIHGGTDGTPFRDKARGRLAEVSVRGGSWLDSVRCSWEDEGEVEKGSIHGGEGGSEEVVKLAPGESLIGLTGVIRGEGDDAVIGSLVFRTTRRTTEPIGGTLEGKKFTLEAPKGMEICGFQGRSGDYLHAIGMVCRPLP